MNSGKNKISKLALSFFIFLGHGVGYARGAGMHGTEHESRAPETYLENTENIHPNQRQDIEELAPGVAEDATSESIPAPANNKNMRAELEILKRKIRCIEKYCVANSKTCSDGCLTKTQKQAVVGTGPYFGLGKNENGSDLVINDPNINKDLTLLRQLSGVTEHLSRCDKGFVPRMQFSGKLEALVVTNRDRSNFFGLSGSYFDLSNSELDLAVLVNPLVLGYTSWSYDSSLTQSSPLRLVLGFITFGNLNYAPVYGSVGQMNMPFGRYATGLSFTSPLTKEIGQIKAKGVNLGYAAKDGKGLYAEAAVYSGRINDNMVQNRAVNQYAGSLGYTIPQAGFNQGFGLDVRVSYTNNIAEAEETAPIFYPVPQPGIIMGMVTHYVDGADASMVMSLGPLSFTAEYLTALRAYSESDVTQNGHAVKPLAYQLEGNYDFKICDRKADFTLSYSRAVDTAVFGPTQEQYGANLSVNILHNIVWSFEFVHIVSYPGNTVIAGNPNVIINPNTVFNGNRDTVSTTLDAFF